MLAGIVFQLGACTSAGMRQSLLEALGPTDAAPASPSSLTPSSAHTQSPSQRSWCSMSSTCSSGTSRPARSSHGKALASSSCYSRCSPRRLPSSFVGCVCATFFTALRVHSSAVMSPLYTVLPHSRARGRLQRLDRAAANLATFRRDPHRVCFHCPQVRSPLPFLHPLTT